MKANRGTRLTLRTAMIAVALIAGLLGGFAAGRRKRVVHTFSAWANVGETVPHTLARGEGPPRFDNGQADPDCQVCLWRIEVGSFEEASAIFDLRRGFAPGRPHGKAEPCPRCGSMFYPSGSGQCWNCGHLQ